MVQKTYEQKLLEYEEQINRIKARKQALIARNSKEERKARNHALIVVGGMVMRCFDDGWQSVDWQGLSSVIEKNEAIFAKHTTEKLPTAEAAKRLRAWESEQRDHTNGVAANAKAETV